MSTHSNVPDAKNLFEAAMIALRNEGTHPLPPSAATVLRRHRPLRDRIGDPEQEKQRALKDAASALAALWARQSQRQ